MSYRSCRDCLCLDGRPCSRPVRQYARVFARLAAVKGIGPEESPINLIVARRCSRSSDLSGFDGAREASPGRGRRRGGLLCPRYPPRAPNAYRSSIKRRRQRRDNGRSEKHWGRVDRPATTVHLLHIMDLSIFGDISATFYLLSTFCTTPTSVHLSNMSNLCVPARTVTFQLHEVS